ncbi:MAG: hypothetical protein IK045_04115 [Bacteroidales bacterium]|nr:hypothetical protein [Bacteroidales bacterium]
MDYNFDTWKKALEDFKKSVTKDLEEIRKQKEEVRLLKEEILSSMNNGVFIRDDSRIVLSAPEIVIGNVDREGILVADGGGRVVLRAGNVDVEGVGDAGSVRTRASSIRSIAVNPGADGLEEVPGDVSEIIAQARQVVLEGSTGDDVFLETPKAAGSGSVRIHADGCLELDASVSSETLKKNLDDRIKALEDEKKAVESEVDSGLKAFGDLSKQIKDVYDQNDGIISDSMTLRTEMSALEDLGDILQSHSSALSMNYEATSRAISRLAEINRQIKALKDAKNAIKGGDDFKKASTGCAVLVSGESINLVSRDGDGNLRDNPEAGVGVLANNIEVLALDKERALQKEGKVLVNAKTVEVSTVNASDLKYDDKGKLTSGKYASEGDVLIKSKTLSVESVDSELKDGKLEEKALTKESAFTVRAEKLDVSATDTEGKATGAISLNAKDVSVRSMNVDKDKRTDDKLAEGSTMLLLSEKMFLGAKKKDIKSKKLQAVSEEVGVFADKTLELQQDEAKAALQLSGGKAALGSSENQVFGKTAVTGAVEVKGEVKAPKATIEHLEAKSSFKSSNISDGIPVPPAPASGNLSAKLKAEDAPEKK